MSDDEWLIRAWHSTALDDRTQAITAARSAGRTLDDVGAEHGMSRERVRQIQLRAQRALAAAADVVHDSWRTALRTAGRGPASPRAAFAAALGVSDHVALDSLLIEAGLGAPSTWAGPLHGWWTTRPDALDAALRELAETAPLRGDELGQAASAVGVPEGVPLTVLLAGSGSRLALSVDGHWVRRRARGRDAAYLWLLEAGRPCKTDELLRPMSATTVGAVREALRRDDRFTQIRPEGTWALTEWSHLRLTPYANAVEALVAVVTGSGPISQASLFMKVTELYPVTPWRLKQCLLSDQIGETADGLVDLVARGARPIEEEEPAQPETMAFEGDVLGVRITVNRDVLRGSGIGVHSWLTWRLGLRQAPMSRTFATVGDHAPLTVRRSTSVAQVSSLRRHALELGMVEGCVLALLLHLSDETAQVRHGCAERECPARALASHHGSTRTA
ncbi:sigma factor-like helix-turn-helix DNA-binding protein [Actinacidiphila glaucinigra]|uniref:sigma factor-like helix-turn-helix DNA-binding protein n=1 Tax=Actinacidiphila glaucinigra TaxID=235986 RepID=UPI0036CD15E7